VRGRHARRPSPAKPDAICARGTARARSASRHRPTRATRRRCSPCRKRRCRAATTPERHTPAAHENARMARRPHAEHHRTERIGWLRAAVLGANDGIVSTASLLTGVVAAGGARREWILVGLAGLVGGAMSMAAGEYVSVSSQRDGERADLALERQELAANPASELHELAWIYVARGVQPELAREVARQRSAHDALAAHARDELGITRETIARPVQAALASAASFSVGAALPLIVVAAAPQSALVVGSSAT